MLLPPSFVVPVFRTMFSGDSYNYRRGRCAKHPLLLGQWKAWQQGDHFKILCLFLEITRVCQPSYAYTNVTVPGNLGIKSPHSLLQIAHPCCCCCCLSHSAYWLPTRKKLLHTVVNPARGLLNREKRRKEKVWILW